MARPPQCEGCPLNKTGRGFVLGSGDPCTAKLAIMLEAPGSTELEGKPTDAELAIRRRDYPDLPDHNLAAGLPAIGPNGKELDMWALAAVQLHRKDVFLDNVLRCLPPKGKSGEHYPTGDERRRAEAHCRVYDRWHLYRPTVSIISLHPAAILRDTTPLPLQIHDFRRALEFASAGERSLVLAGGKAAELWLARNGINVLRLRGSYEFERQLLSELRERSCVKGLGLGDDKAPKAGGRRKRTTTEGSAGEQPAGPGTPTSPNPFGRAPRRKRRKMPGAFKTPDPGFGSASVKEEK